MNHLEFEQWLIDQAALYMKERGVEPTIETLAGVCSSMANVASLMNRHTTGTSRIEFFKRMLLIAQLAGEDGLS